MCTRGLFATHTHAMLGATTRGHGVHARQGGRHHEARKVEGTKEGGAIAGARHSGRATQSGDKEQGNTPPLEVVAPAMMPSDKGSNNKKGASLRQIRAQRER